MAERISGAPSKIMSGVVTLNDYNPVKLVDARPTRSRILVTCSAIDVGLGDASITDSAGHFIPHLNQFEIHTADEVWCVVRSGRALGQRISFIEFYD